jgi:hypothetical protein
MSAFDKTEEKPNTQATARVKVTLEIPLSQPWGSDANIDGIRKRATEEAEQKVRQAVVSQEPGGLPRGTKLLSTKVTAVLVAEKD